MNVVAGAVNRVAGSTLATLVGVAVGSALAVGIGVALRLTWAGSIGLYFVVWWTALFAILPVRVRSQVEAGDVVQGSEPGAPANPALRERALWTTLVSMLVFAAVAYLFPLAGL